MTSRTPDIETGRLILKEITEKDTEVIIRLRSNPDVYKYFLSVHELTATEHIKWFKTQYLHDESRFDYIARVKGNNIAIGVFGIKKMGQKIVETNYILNHLYRGKGYAHEAIFALLEFAKQEWECKTAIAKIHKDNNASIHFAESSGFNPVFQEGNFITYNKQL